MTRTDYDSWGKPFPPELNLFVRKGHRTLKTGRGGRTARRGAGPFLNPGARGEPGSLDLGIFTCGARGDSMEDLEESSPPLE